MSSARRETMGTPDTATKPKPDLIGRYELVRPSLDRQLAMDAYAAIGTGHPMMALLELDVTNALTAIDRLRRQGRRVSLFAFLVHAIALAISEHPDLNLVRHGKRLARFDDVDVSVPVEVQTPDGPFPRQVVVRRAQDASVERIYTQLTDARRRHEERGETSSEDRWARRLMASVAWLPAFVRVAIARALIQDAFRIKEKAGTTLVSSVGKFATIPGFSFTFGTGPRAAAFVIGSVVEKPWNVAGRVALRSVVSLSVLVDHDLVDGAPVARFATRLKDLVESAHGLDVVRAA